MFRPHGDYRPARGTRSIRLDASHRRIDETGLRHAEGVSRTDRNPLYRARNVGGSRSQSWAGAERSPPSEQVRWSNRRRAQTLFPVSGSRTPAFEGGALKTGGWHLSHDRKLSASACFALSRTYRLRSAIEWTEAQLARWYRRVSRLPMSRTVLSRAVAVQVARSSARFGRGTRAHWYGRLALTERCDADGGVRKRWRGRIGPRSSAGRDVDSFRTVQGNRADQDQAITIDNRAANPTASVNRRAINQSRLFGCRLPPAAATGPVSFPFRRPTLGLSDTARPGPRPSP